MAITLPYIDRDYQAVFESIKSLFSDLEPRVEIDENKANVETIITKIIAGCVDSLSYNQDANILEAFPSTARDARAVYDLLSIVGYTPKTARSSKIYLNLWNPSFSGSVTYYPYTNLIIDGKNFYNPDEFTVTQGVLTSTEFYQGKLIAPDFKTTENKTEDDNQPHNFLDNYYPNLSASTIKNDLYALPNNHTMIDSRTVRVFSADGEPLTYVENPYLVYTTKASFSLIPTVNSTGYSLMFSKDVSAGVVSKNYYYFYVVSEGYNVANNLTPDFKYFGTPTPSFSFNYIQEESKDPETANEARKSVVYEFGWRDTPKAIITRYDCERSILQNTAYVAAVDVRDGNNYSKADPKLFDIQVFVKLTEDAEARLDVGSATSYKNRVLTHLNKFKMLPLNYTVHIDNVQTEPDENVTEIYHWYPDITIYLKEQVTADEAGAVLQEANNALLERYKYINVNFNEVPRIVDIIDTVQNSSDIILYLDIDGVNYTDVNGNSVTKEQVTGAYTDSINIIPDQMDYIITLNTQNNTRNIQYHTVKIVDSNNVLIGYDNGEGVILSSTGYLDNSEGYGTIDYTTGELKIKFATLPVSSRDNAFYVFYQQETPTFCKYISSNAANAIKIGLESIKVPS